MVWIDGGSVRFGASSPSSYDGSELARRGVSVVTINNRLGLFGTFATRRSPRWRTGRQLRLLNAIAALRWVRDIIGGFGSGPRAVTLFGKWAGGVSVGYLMAAPLAEGLFHRTIIQSGGLSLPEFPRAHAAGIAERLAGSWHAATAEALRAVPGSGIPIPRPLTRCRLSTRQVILPASLGP